MGYDIFIDEDKQNRFLGILALKNQPPFEQVLTQVRARYGVREEIKWSDLSRFKLPIAVSWVRVLDWYRGARCFILPWQGNKEELIAAFINRFCSDRRLMTLGGLNDAVLFVDFDTAHKATHFESYIRRETGILRCYQLDSRTVNCLQLVDLVLGAWVRSQRRPPSITEMTLPEDWQRVDDTLGRHQLLSRPSLSTTQCKDYLAWYLQRKLRRNNGLVVEVRGG